MGNSSCKDSSLVSSGHDYRFALLTAAVFTAVTAWSTFSHEMWRDELQAWLIARDSPTLFDLFYSSRYEGHPILWFILLWPITHVTRDPQGMQWLNLALAGCTVFVVARFAPVARWLRIVGCFGYFLAYEYGTISRNYALGLLLIVMATALFPRRREFPLLMGGVLFFAAQTALPVCILVIALTSTLAAEAFGHRPERRPSMWAVLLLAAAGIVISVIQMVPPADSRYGTDWNLRPHLSDIARVLERSTAAFFPLPRPGMAFWETWLLGDLPGAWLGAPFLFCIMALALVRRPLALLYFSAGALGLLAFFTMKNLESLRHHGFLFVCAATALWMGDSLRPVHLPPPLDSVSSWAARMMKLIAPCVLLSQVAGAGISIVGEHSLVFSGAKATAELIRERGLQRLPMLVDRDYMGMSVIGYLDKDRVWFPAGSRFGSYVVWDTTRFVTHGAWGEGVRLALRMNSPTVLILDEYTLKEQPLPPELHPATTFVGYRRGEVATDESYNVFLLDPTRIPRIIVETAR